MKTFNNAVVYINLDKFEKNLPPVGSHSSFFLFSLYGSISFLDFICRNVSSQVSAPGRWLLRVAGPERTVSRS